jgi:hypothetical protein
MAELVDLAGSDRRHAGFINVGHASTDHLAAEEADDVDGLANLGQVVSAVLVEHVDRARGVIGSERDAEDLRLGHVPTMAGKR